MTKPLKKKNKTSHRQITACRENSKKSTGPRNVNATRLNATTNGMNSVLIKNETSLNLNRCTPVCMRICSRMEVLRKSCSMM